MKRLIATFRPQSWEYDTLRDIGGNVEFDATENFLNNDVEDIRDFTEHDNDSDSLADGLPERENHDGPFEVDADIDQWLINNGVEDGRAGITQEHLDRLRREEKESRPAPSPADIIRGIVDKLNDRQRRNFIYNLIEMVFVDDSEATPDSPATLNVNQEITGSDFVEFFFEQMEELGIYQELRQHQTPTVD